jgi:hypothetical protein
VLVLLFVVSPWIAAIGFVTMIGSAMLIYRYLGQLGRDQIRALQTESGSLTGIIGRIASRFRPPAPTDEE